MAKVVSVHFAGLAPIPVGHEVEVRTFSREEGLFSKTLEHKADEPLIVDIDTGVTYGQDWHFQEIHAYVSGEVRPDLPLEVRSDLHEQERWRGTVTACRVAWIGGGDSRYPQTTLLVELAAAKGYR